ncbi:MAG: YhgE/Pip domain-containing protein [Brooklawnia sp.]|jgi:uncharacterized phage infection (PIP) family protein YhgE
MNAAQLQSSRAAWLRPLLAVLAAIGVVTLLGAPMMVMKPRELPIAVANLDQGAQTSAGEANASEQVIAQLTASDMDGMVQWLTYTSQEEIDQALEDNEVYAALVVPGNFTMASAAAAQGAGEAEPIVLTINEGKNPMVSTQLATAFGALTSGDLPVVQQAFHPIPRTLGASAMFLPVVLVLMTFASSLVGGFATATALPLGPTGRWKTVAAQTALAVVVAPVVGLVCVLVVNAITGAGLPVVDMAVFFGLSSLALMTVVIASVNLLGAAGLVIPMLFLLLGMATGNLAYELLPAFWQNFVYPWNPLRFMGDGARALAFQGAGWWNAATPAMVVLLVIGLVLVATSVLGPRGRAVSASQSAA